MGDYDLALRNLEQAFVEHNPDLLSGNWDPYSIHCITTLVSLPFSSAWVCRGGSVRGTAQHHAATLAPPMNGPVPHGFNLPSSKLGKRR